MKWTARDILSILRLFAVAEKDTVPRNIERLAIHNPDEFTTVFDFSFEKHHYFVVVNSDMNDDPQLAEAACQVVDSNLPIEIVENPNDDTANYATRFHGKVIYLAREVRTSTRLDIHLANNRPEHSRSTWQKLIKTGVVTVNGEVKISPKTAVSLTDVVESTGAPHTDFSDHTLPIIYQDDNVIVLNKPVGILTHSKGALNDEFTVADFFRRFTENGLDTNRPGIIHRLDRDTSGVIIGALNDETALLLKKQFSERTTKKTYYAVVEKAPEHPAGLIDVPIGRNPSAPSTFRADPNGKSAKTAYKTVATADDGRVLLQLKPETGRTHQLRVHLDYIGSPIIGDRVYGREGERLMLHAFQLEITIPKGQREVFTADLPDIFKQGFPEIKP